MAEISGDDDVGCEIHEDNFSVMDSVEHTGDTLVDEIFGHKDDICVEESIGHDDVTCVEENVLHVDVTWVEDSVVHIDFTWAEILVWHDVDNWVDDKELTVDNVFTGCVEDAQNDEDIKCVEDKFFDISFSFNSWVDEPLVGYDKSSVTIDDDFVKNDEDDVDDFK